MSRKSNRLKNRLRIIEQQAAQNMRLSLAQAVREGNEKAELRREIERLKKSHIVLRFDTPPDHPEMTRASLRAEMYDPSKPLSPVMVGVDEMVEMRHVGMSRAPGQYLKQIGMEISERLVRYAAERGLHFKDRTDPSPPAAG